MVSFMFFTAVAVRFYYSYEEGYSPEIPFNYGFASVLTYGLGAIIYAHRFPEKYFPSKFDYLGASHQIWHLFVLVGVYLNY
jgi:adiponectin receptor